LATFCTASICSSKSEESQLKETSEPNVTCPLPSNLIPLEPPSWNEPLSLIYHELVEDLIFLPVISVAEIFLAVTSNELIYGASIVSFVILVAIISTSSFVKPEPSKLSLTASDIESHEISTSDPNEIFPEPLYLIPSEPPSWNAPVAPLMNQGLFTAEPDLIVFPVIVVPVSFSALTSPNVPTRPTIF
jgi:hypothetical protein